MAGRSEEHWAGWPGPGFDGADRRCGDYVLGRQIGAGGMGVVYEARRVDLDRKVAIKLIRDPQTASPVRLCRFTLEAEAVARLDHPNIVRLHEVGECHGHPFFSMDLIAGESLAAKIARGEFPSGSGSANAAAPEGRQPWESIARLMSRIARAVHHAHGRGVLHRDLKPGNILIDAQGQPHLTDFGLAKILQAAPDDDRLALTTAGDMPGTPNYMAPEQVCGFEATRLSDVHGLGAVLYELLTGRPPFGGHTSLETFRQITESQPARPRRLIPAIPPDLEIICLKCIEKDPRHRYISAEALAEDLDHWIAGQPIQARLPGASRRMGHWIRRNPVGTALIASLCLGLSVSLALLKVVNDQRNEIERNWQQTFDDGMSDVTLIWQERSRKEVTISPQKLAVLADRSPQGVSRARHQLCFGISSDGEPSSMAQRYARLLTSLQQEMERELGETVAFRLRLFKRYNQDEDSLARGEADLMMLSAVDYLNAAALAPGVVPIAREKQIRETVLFAHTNAGIQSLAELAGRSLALPDPDLALTAWAKARLAKADLRAKDLRGCTNIVDQGADAGQAAISYEETIKSVLAGTADAGVTYRDLFELKKHYGLRELDSFLDTPNVLVARRGLDPKLIQALRIVLRSLESRAETDSSAVGLPGEMLPVEDSYFDPLRQAMRQAAWFEGRTDVRD